jgi:hypothetical protein
MLLARLSGAFEISMSTCTFKNENVEACRYSVIVLRDA